MRTTIDGLSAIGLGLLFGAATFLLGFAVGSPIETKPQPERYSLLGCPPDTGVCIAFDTATGLLHATPKPNLPKTGEHEVKGPATWETT